MTLLPDESRVRKVLDEIDAILVDEGRAGQLLWDILTALRGPDRDADASVKWTSTARVRARAFPKTARVVMDKYARYGAYNGDGAPIVWEPRVVGPREVYRMRHSSHHFVDHIRAASLALERVAPVPLGRPVRT